MTCPAGNPSEMAVVEGLRKIRGESLALQRGEDVNRRSVPFLPVCVQVTDR